MVSAQVQVSTSPTEGSSELLFGGEGRLNSQPLELRGLDFNCMFSVKIFPQIEPPPNTENFYVPFSEN